MPSGPQAFLGQMCENRHTHSIAVLVSCEKTLDSNRQKKLFSSLAFSTSFVTLMRLLAGDMFVMVLTESQCFSVSMPEQ